MQTTQDVNELRSKLHSLQVEHRDLDEVITRLTTSPPHDELLLRRLKNVTVVEVNLVTPQKQTQISVTGASPRIALQ